MAELTPEQIARYHHHSYAAVDGLWFLKVEEKYGFEAALDIDIEVWKVMPKIQLRMLKGMLGFENGMEALSQCVDAKLLLERFIFKNEKTENGFSVTVEKCPWHETIVRSGRGALLERILTRIFHTEFPAFIAEIDRSIHFELKSQICAGAEVCVLQFSK